MLDVTESEQDEIGCTPNHYIFLMDRVESCGRLGEAAKTKKWLALFGIPKLTRKKEQVCWRKAWGGPEIVH
jgi:hypothetical protein